MYKTKTKHQYLTLLITIFTSLNYTHILMLPSRLFTFMILHCSLSWTT